MRFLLEISRNEVLKAERDCPPAVLLFCFSLFLLLQSWFPVFLDQSPNFYRPAVPEVANRDTKATAGFKKPAFVVHWVCMGHCQDAGRRGHVFGNPLTVQGKSFMWGQLLTAAACGWNTV